VRGARRCDARWPESSAGRHDRPSRRRTGPGPPGVSREAHLIPSDVSTTSLPTDGEQTAAAPVLPTPDPAVVAHASDLPPAEAEADQVDAAPVPAQPVDGPPSEHGLFVQPAGTRAPLRTPPVVAAALNAFPDSLEPTDGGDTLAGVAVAEIVVPAVPDAPVAPPFADLGVLPVLVEALADQGIHTAFPIQTMAVPLALLGTDLIGQARTGTGKTLGFALPILQSLAQRSEADRADRRPRALVVAPTRELASQVAGEFRMAGARLGARVATIYGGRAYEPQIAELTAGVDVVVGTPGRLLDLHGQRLLDLSAVGVLVLDEADEMLDLGFLPDVERIIAATPEGRQTMLFSATMPGAVVSLARRHLTNPVNLRAESAHDTQMVPETTQFVYQAHAMDKIEIVARLLQARGRGLAMVFARTKRTAQRVADDLAERGFAAAPLHGDLGQGAREQALRAFRAGKVDVLVCTDVAARGIDVDGVTHVVNWACPEDERTYLHRIGRTGRAGATGIAVTFVDWEDVTRWRVINNALGLPFGEPQETYSTSPHLFAELDIPDGTRGTLPLAGRSRAGLSAETVEDLGGREPRALRPPRGAERGGDRDAGSGAARNGGGRSGPAGRAAAGRGAGGTDSGPGRDAGRSRRSGTAGGGAVTGGTASTGAVTGGAVVAASGSGESPAAPVRSAYTIHNPDSERSDAGSSVEGGEITRPARRRRRVGSGTTGSATVADAGSDPVGGGRDHDRGAPPSAEQSDGAGDAPRRRRRRRSRGGAEGRLPEADSQGSHEADHHSADHHSSDRTPAGAGGARESGV